MIRVKVWDDQLDAHDCGDTTSQWFSHALGTHCRLVRFHAGAKRIASTKWTEGIEVPTLFSDSFPMLVVGSGSLDDLNQKLVAQGRSTLPMDRFRPNLVFSDIAAFEEDFASQYKIGTAILKPVKPCVRCPVPSVDQGSGEFGPDPLDILCSYRVNPKVDDGITFGMNVILLEGEGQQVHIGQTVECDLSF